MSAEPPAQRQRTPVEDIQVVTIPVLHPRQQVVPGSRGIISAHTLVFDRDRTDEIIALLRKKAHEVGADAVVGAQFFSQPPATRGGAPVLRAVGTPVLLPWPDGHNDPAHGLD